MIVKSSFNDVQASVLKKLLLQLNTLKEKYLKQFSDAIDRNFYAELRNFVKDKVMTFI